ncbi:MAG: peptide chain release factor 2 [Pseudomonadota bacterium]|nr:peptide chain release factor 2 [Pseudomonadota bacterium]
MASIVDLPALASSLRERLVSLRGHLDVDGKLEQIADIDRQASIPEFWNDAVRAREVLKKKTQMEKGVRLFQESWGRLEDAETYLELADEAGDPSIAQEANVALERLEGELRAMEIRRMLGEESDEAGAILEVNAGAGGTDAADWADMLKRMYLRWADRMGFKVKIIDEQLHEEAGIRSCTLEIEGDYAYGYLKGEIGVHRLVRISPFDSNARRHTAFASVAAYPDIEEDIEVVILEKDLRIDTFRSGGPGGQSVNTTDSAVRIVHNPTGIVVQCQNEKSQLKNRSTAMKMLRVKLYQLELERRQSERDLVNATKKKIEWGSQIRSYVLQPYRLVKDVRTGMETGDTDSFLDGRLLPFMEQYLVARANGTLGEGGSADE